MPILRSRGTILIALTTLLCHNASIAALERFRERHGLVVIASKILEAVRRTAVTPALSPV